jgi:hypothetical protein
MYLMHRSRYSCCTAGRKLLLTAMVLPHLLYCIEVWHCCGQTLGGSVELLFRQRHCIRTVLNDVAFKPVQLNIVLYNLLELLPLSFEFQFHSARILFSILRLNSVPNLKDLFQRRVVSRQTRESNDILLVHVPRTSTERERFAISWWGSVLWSRIPASIRNAECLNEFRQEYRQYLLRNLNDANLNR